MSLSVLDHLLAVILCAVVPIWGVVEHRKLATEAGKGNPRARLAAYRRTILVSWGLALAVLAVWLVQGRELGTLGLGFAPGWGFWVVVALTLAACALLILQMRGLERDPVKLAALRPQLASVEALLPRDDLEWTGFRSLSVTAGICEEVLYRGYLFAYFSSHLGAWPAAGLAIFFFGTAHAYQGPPGIVKTGLVGAVFTGLYALGGSLWAPMALHAVVDWTSGKMGMAVLRTPDAPATPDASAAPDAGLSSPASRAAREAESGRPGIE